MLKTIDSPFILSIALATSLLFGPSVQATDKSDSAKLPALKSETAEMDMPPKAPPISAPNVPPSNGGQNPPGYAGQNSPAYQGADQVPNQGSYPQESPAQSAQGYGQGQMPGAMPGPMQGQPGYGRGPQQGPPGYRRGPMQRPMQEPMQRPPRYGAGGGYMQGQRQGNAQRAPGYGQAQAQERGPSQALGPGARTGQMGGNYGGYQSFGNSDHFYGGHYHVQPHYYGSAAYQGGFNNSPRSSTVYAPQGLNLPVTLQTAISTQVAKPGDLIQGEISHMVSLGGRGYIPAGTQIVGDVAQAKSGRRLSRSGALSIEFTSMRLPSGQQVPISAHLVGSIGKYKNKGKGSQDLYRGEGVGTKVGQFFLRGLGGAGLGAALGTGLGAIAGGRSGVGRGAWGGAAIGGGLGAADMLLRKGKDVIIPTGTEIQIQLDQPAALPSFAADANQGAGYGGYNNGGGFGGYGGRFRNQGYGGRGRPGPQSGYYGNQGNQGTQGRYQGAF